jgi:hypothetical protein
MKKIVFLVLSLMAVVCQAEEITITNEEQLRELASSGKTYAGDVIKLANDIVLTEGTVLEPVYWTPIGTPEIRFQGTFDGQGHSITGIRINYDTGIEYTGLFGYIGTDGVVKNTRVAAGSSPIYSAGEGLNSCFVGGIAGQNDGKISQCVVTSDISASHENARGGGIAGHNTGTIENCYVVADIYALNSTTIHLGGVAGYNGGTLRNCWIKGTVTGISQTSRDYICGSGSYTGCFYANGSSANVSLANMGDNSSILSDQNGVAGLSVLLNGRTLYTDDSWNTLCLPFDIAASSDGLSPIAGATVMEMTSASLTGSQLSIHFSPATSIIAGKPYLVKWSDTGIGNIVNPVFLNTTIVNVLNTTVTCGDDVSFVGTLSGVSVSANDQSLRFLSAGNTLYYPNQSMTLGSCRAYFKFTQSVEARQLILSFDDGNTTSLTTARLERTNDSNDWFNLNGQRLTEKPNMGGIYLHHGKKIIVK